MRNDEIVSPMTEKYQLPLVNCDLCNARRPCVRPIEAWGVELSACHVCCGETACEACGEEDSCS